MKIWPCYSEQELQQFQLYFTPHPVGSMCEMHLENLRACRGVRCLVFVEILQLLTFLQQCPLSWLCDIQLSSGTLHQQVGLKVLDKRIESKVLYINIAIKIQQSRSIRIKSQLFMLLKNLRHQAEKLQHMVSETLYRKWKFGLCTMTLQTLYLS